MGNSAFRKKPNEKNLTRKMIQQRMDDMAALMVAMEATLMEWEVWYRLIPMMTDGMSDEEFKHYVMDGPIFTDTPGKIMESIRQHIPEVEPPEEKPKPGILDGSGNVANVNDKKILSGPDGKPIIRGESENGETQEDNKEE
jgi:hypothetical protein